MRMVISRPRAWSAISLLPSPVMACTGLPMQLAQSFDHRSPHRLSVGRAPSITLMISARAVTRSVIFPSCSPARNTSWPAPEPFSMPRPTSPAFQSATPILGMMSPTERSAPRDGGHDGIVPAVLGRDHVALRLQVGQGHPGGPRGVVGLHRDEGDVEVGVQALQLVDVQRLS